MGNFIALAIRSPLVQVQIDALKTQTAQSNLFQGKIKKLVIPLPPMKEQTEIVRIAEEAIEASNAQDNHLDAALAELTQLDQSILAKAFRGELVQQDPSDEPASQLLHRIRTTRAQLEAERKAAKAATKKKATKKRKAKKHA